jgi:two-component system, NarL family, nitrate/nitrite response regulator NarL
MTQSISTRADLRILIIEDHVLFAESLELALTLEGYDVRRVPVPQEERAAGALAAAVVRLRPRVVLLDLDLGGFGDGVRLVSTFARSGVNVVVVTASVDPGRWGEAVWYGARKVLSKSRPLNDILAVVRRINHNQPVMSREEREELLDRWHRERADRAGRQERFKQLTVRERQVLAHLVRGHTVREIAETSVVSEATVRTQVKSILAKLKVTSQLAAVGLAHNIGWVPPDVSQRNASVPVIGEVRDVLHKGRPQNGETL